MNMHLTLEEQRKLNPKPKIPSNRSFATCTEGHELAVLCYRIRVRPSTVTRLKDMFYCQTCDKVYRPSMVEVKI